MNFLDTSDAYRKLDSFTLARIIELGTHHFCHRFLDLTDDASISTYDRMNQAARSARHGHHQGFGARRHLARGRTGIHRAGAEEHVGVARGIRGMADDEAAGTLGSAIG